MKIVHKIVTDIRFCKLTILQIRQNFRRDYREERPNCPNERSICAKEIVDALKEISRRTSVARTYHTR
ncbi:MAG: hypothetical protein Q4D23_12260, partial [Bacteroidales bacterium]|nr:hypothetical protein [Bacteroidales bacterium]